MSTLGSMRAFDDPAARARSWRLPFGKGRQLADGI